MVSFMELGLFHLGRVSLLDASLFLWWKLELLQKQLDGLVDLLFLLFGHVVDACAV